MNKQESSNEMKVWFAQLQKLAKERDVEWAVTDIASHADGFTSGLTPAEELDEQIDAARW